MMNMDDVVIHVQGMLEKANPPISEECCIYRVPLLIRQINHEAYTPKVVSIGPYHHNNSHLQNMERHKLTYCKSFLERTNTRMESWINYIADLLRNFYLCGRKQTTRSSQWQQIPSVTKLSEAGIRFETNEISLS
ncbi:hypothetical protein VIGAN_02082900 [Vigna angularis var. angularis]|uniref:Uncharacterized protein n=1 Tax=Vigna angularis var. angularis TaxID=157739 RepID=A0A0S3RCP4_PHAAN|nr:hypothetical protein VIGAN_02082900 [Vigna angularis var. angularis]